MVRTLKILALVVLFGGISACGMPMHEFDIMPPHVSRISHTYRQLTSLPKPKGKIRVSVYDFRDQTGQYKPQPNVSSFSTAVTQGAVNMLLQALNRSNWFTPVERDGLQNLLTERKIISAATMNGDQGKQGGGKLPPLEWASIILQGGITAYETNTLTGGFGAEYWGLGGSTQYRLDQVTVHLRAVDVRSGRILKSVSTTKTILSYEVDVGIFRFLTFKKLLEIEAGYSQNEPVQMCVAAAIEKAVIALVVEGVLDRLWELENPEDIGNEVIKDYQDESQRLDIAAELKASEAKAAEARKAEIDKAAWEKMREIQAEQEAARKAEEEEARLEVERQAQEEAARIEAEHKAQEEEKARLEAERQAQEEEKARLEAERQAQEEAARIEAERKAQEDKTRLEAELKAQEEEAARLEAEQAREKEARLEAQRQAEQAEAARMEAEDRAREEEAARLEAERKALEEAGQESQSQRSGELESKVNEAPMTVAGASGGEAPAPVAEDNSQKDGRYENGGSRFVSSISGTAETSDSGEGSKVFITKTPQPKQFVPAASDEAISASSSAEPQVQ